MVSFKFRTSKTVNSATEASEKVIFMLDLLLHVVKENDIFIMDINGFTPKNVSQVIAGAKKSHAGYSFLDFFKLTKEEKEKYINLIDITTKI